MVRGKGTVCSTSARVDSFVGKLAQNGGGQLGSDFEGIVLGKQFQAISHGSVRVNLYLLTSILNSERPSGRPRRMRFRAFAGSSASVLYGPRQPLNLDAVRA